jgi:hypothetical protein
MEDFKDVKIIKKCEEKQEQEVPQAEECKSFNFEGQDFLKNIDEEILFIDDSIEFKEKQKFIEEIFSQKSTESKQVESDTPKASPPICFKNVPQKISKQISLPIDNIDELSFYETFIINQKIETTDECDIDEETDVYKANEIGSACLMVEELSDGNILIFTIQQLFINGVRTANESLSVVTKNLRLIQEKRIERKCSDGWFEVSLKREISKI